MSGQCSLCLSCGAPFIPAGEDMVEYDRLGNISVFYLQKLVRTNLEMQASIKTPSFCAKPDSSHILHKNHHLPAVQFVADYVFNARDGVTYPFIRAPTGKRPGRRLAKWALPDDTRRLDMTPLLDLITSLSPDARQGEDFRHEILCCSNCNHTMTMNFWFRYHLYSGPEINEDCLIPEDTIEVFRVNTQDRPALEDATDYWQEDTSEGTYPQRRYRASHDIMSPAVAYYLTMCLPERDHMIHRNEGLLHRSLYVHMCWVVLEVTCLLCEYWRGSLDMENHERRQQKRYQCHKSPLGAAELYFSYFCWRVLGFEHAGVGVMSFVHFHQLYMWSAAGCEALFPHRESDASGGLLADLICPSTTDAPSRPLIEAVASKMVGVFQRIRPLGLHLSGRGNTRLARYFLPPKYIPELTLLARGGVPPDFDSFATRVGIDAMLFRVIALGRDLPPVVRRRLLQFRSAWRQAEVQNVARNSGRKGATPAAAAVPYRLCKLLDPPSVARWAAMSAAEADETLRGPQCSPWACVLALNELGAFDMPLQP